MPLKIDSVIAASLKRATGDYGFRARGADPPNLVQPLTGITATLLELLDLGRWHHARACRTSASRAAPAAS